VGSELAELGRKRSLSSGCAIARAGSNFWPESSSKGAPPRPTSTRKEGGMDFFDWFCVVYWTSTLLFVGFLFLFGG
jgi:hypothetical protein